MASARGIGFWIGAWVASAALWLVLTDSLRVAELLAGAAVAALAATGVERVRRERVAAQRLRPRLFAGGWRVFVRIVPDVWRLTRAAFLQVAERRPVRGVVVAIPFRGERDDPDARGRRSVAAGLGSVSPNSIVVGADPESRTLLVHQLEPTRKAEDLDPLGLR
jgi:multisubunit Na+/H+ antiporter MnhE subunit